MITSFLSGKIFKELFDYTIFYAICPVVEGL